MVTEACISWILFIHAIKQVIKLDRFGEAFSSEEKMSNKVGPEKVTKQEPIVDQPVAIEIPTVTTVTPVIPGQTVGKFS